MPFSLHPNGHIEKNNIFSVYLVYRTPDLTIFFDNIHHKNINKSLGKRSNAKIQFLLGIAIYLFGLVPLDNISEITQM